MNSTLKLSLLELSNQKNIDEEMIILINSLIKEIKENYKLIKNEINEWKIIYQNETLLIEILVKIELDMKSFISKAKETIKKLKIVRKNKIQKDSINNYIRYSPSPLYKKANFIKFHNKNIRSSGNIFHSSSQNNINSSFMNSSVSSEKNNNIYNNKKNLKRKKKKEKKNCSIIEEKTNNFENKRINKERRLNNNYINKKNNVSNKLQLSERNNQNKTKLFFASKLIDENKLKQESCQNQNSIILNPKNQINKNKKELNKKQINKDKFKNDIKHKNNANNDLYNIYKTQKKIDNNSPINNLEFKITKLTSNMRISNNLYIEKISKIKQEIKNHLENIKNIKNEIEEKELRTYEKEEEENNIIINNHSENNNSEDTLYLDIIEENKIQLNELSKRNSELSLNNKELENSRSEILKENNLLIKIKEELENKVSNLEEKLEKINNKNLNIIEDDKKDNEKNLNPNNEDNKEKVNEITEQLKELQKNIKIKDLTINNLTDEINIKDNQISELIVEKVNLSNYINSHNGTENSLFGRSKSEKHYLNLKKENNQLIKQMIQISDNLGELIQENKSNKKTIEQLNKKINILNSKENIIKSKDIIKLYENKLKEINNEYKNNEKYLKEQIKELSNLNIEKDKNNKILQNEFLKLKTEFDEINKRK